MVPPVIFRIVIPAALLAVALVAWYMESATEPDGAAQPAAPAQVPAASPTGLDDASGDSLGDGTTPLDADTSAAGSGAANILDTITQLGGPEVAELAGRLRVALDGLPDGTKSCMVVRQRDAGGGESSGTSQSDSRPTLGTVFEHNPQLSLVPASNQKIITAAAALLSLGPDYRLSTRVLASQPLSDGVIFGDLYLVGGGDPLLYTADYVATFTQPPAAHTMAEELAQQLHDRGLRLVNGSIVGVETRYDSRRQASDAAANFFVGPLSALLINDGYLNYTARRDLGEVPVAAADPAQQSASLFDDLLENLEVVITGRPRSAGVADDLGGYIELARIDSAPLSELMESLLADSDNTSAELLLKEIAVYNNYLDARAEPDVEVAPDIEAEPDASAESDTQTEQGARVDVAYQTPQEQEPPQDTAPTETTAPDDTTAPDAPDDTDAPDAPAPTVTTAPDDAASEPAPTETTAPAAPDDTAPDDAAPDDTTPTTTTEPERIIPQTEDPDENPLATQPGSTQLGAQYVGEILSANGISSWVGTPRDGSGLDRGNLLSCQVIADVLDTFGPDSNLASAMAIAGRTGTLSQRFTDTPLDGRLLAKTGSLPGVVALSGFIPGHQQSTQQSTQQSQQQQSLSFALLINYDQAQATTAQMEAATQEIALLLQQYLDG